MQTCIKHIDLCMTKANELMACKDARLDPAQVRTCVSPVHHTPYTPYTPLVQRIERMQEGGEDLLSVVGHRRYIEKTRVEAKKES
jgi:hypothetical protein